MKIGAHDSHPAADVFPLMAPAALAGLVEDIRASGLLRPIVLLGGKILDGRNRYLACLAAKVEPVFTEWTGGTEPEDLARYVCSENLARRDLDMGQRALCARRLVNLAKQQRVRRKVQAVLPHVSDTDAAMATALEQDGTPELIAAVDAGEVTLAIAAAASQLEPDEQRKVVAAMTAPEVEPVRAVKREDKLVSLAVDLTPVDLAALRALCLQADHSVHGDVKAGAAVVRRIVPMVRR